MNKLIQRFIPHHPGTYSLMLVLCWTAVMALSLAGSLTSLRREITTIAGNTAGTYIDKDVLYRNWNALHGGIYVPVNQGLAPNAYYPPSMPDRDVVTPSGRHLTFVNQVHNNDGRTARMLAEKIRSRVSQHSFIHVGQVTASFGVARLYPDDTAESLVKRADQAMYSAKHAGRNRVETLCNCHSVAA